MEMNNMYISDALDNILNHAINTVPYYMNFKRNRSISSLNEFPIVDKKSINEQYNSFISNIYDAYTDDIAIMPTSGSSGVYLKVLWRKSDRLISDCYAWKMRNRWYGITPVHKWISFHSELYSGNRIDNVDLNRDYVINKNLMSINMKLLYEMNYNKIMELIKKHNPTWILGFPSILNSIANYAINNDIVFNNLKYVECMGEILFPNIKSNLKKAFSKSHIVNMYGTTETGVVALECPYGNMHILKENCIVEITKNKSVLLTSLTNRIMPFIRYEIGDIASMKNVECGCGYNSDCIDNIQGRNNDFILLRNGRIISAMSLTRIFELINDEYTGAIKSFKITQENIDYFIVDIEMDNRYNGWESVISEKIMQRFYEVIQRKVNIDVNIQEKQMLSSNNSKYKFFVSKLKKGNETNE